MGLDRRFLRYRDSITRGGTFTSTMCQSMTEVHEVHDSNDLALSEAGSSSGDRPPFHSRSHSRRSHSRSPCPSNHNSFRQPPHLRRPNHPRHYHLNQEQPLVVDFPRGQSLSPELAKGKSCSLKLWKAPESREVVIQLTTLPCAKEKSDGTCRDEKKTGNTEYHHLGSNANSLYFDRASVKGHPQGRNLAMGNDDDDDEDKDPWVTKDDEKIAVSYSEPEAMSQADARTKASSMPGFFRDSFTNPGLQGPTTQPPQKVSVQDHHHNAFHTDSTALADASLFSDFVSHESNDNERSQNGSSVFERGDVSENLGKDSIPLKAIQEWNGVVMKGDSPNKLRSSIIEWTNKPPECVSSPNKPISSQGPQNQPSPVTMCSTDQHGTIVYVGPSTNGQCVKL